MTKEEKIERLKLILNDAKLVITKSDRLVNNMTKGFGLVIMKTPTNAPNEITFDNIGEAVFIIMKSKKITNKTETKIKADILKLCDMREIDSNDTFSIIFSTT